VAFARVSQDGRKLLESCHIADVWVCQYTDPVLEAHMKGIRRYFADSANVHPFAPADQRQGYAALDRQLRAWLSSITGYADVSLQPNAGSQGDAVGDVLTSIENLIGGAGNDVYVADASDSVSETSTLASEIDTIETSSSWTLGANLENLRLLGYADLAGTGNALNNSAIALDIAGAIALTAGASWTIANWLKRGRAERRPALAPGWPAQRAGLATSRPFSLPY